MLVLFQVDERTSRFDEMKIDTKKELSNEFGSNIFFDYDLKKRNWFNIGGKCKIFFKAENLKIN